jgi:hypothetical protein
VTTKATTPAAARKLPISLEIDVVGNFAHVAYAGHVSAADMKGGLEDARIRLQQLRAGFAALVDLSGLERMDLDCVPHLARIMDLFLASGVGLVVRVAPDPSKDIGFNILTITHYRGKVPVITCDTVEEARRALKRS